MAYLARHWEDWYGKALRQFEDDLDRDLVAAFAALQEGGHIELITSSATHGYSALLSQDTSIQAQVKQGVAAYERHFGRKPEGYWLPECSYRPRYHWAAPEAVPGSPKTPYLRKGVEEFLAENGIRYFFVDAQLLRGGESLGVYADKFGPLKKIWQQFEKESVRVEYRPFTPYRGYLVNSEGAPDAPRVAAFGRDHTTGEQVWSGDHGYPGDEWYLEFHKKFMEPAAKTQTLGLRYWRISRNKADLGTKLLYEPRRAAERIRSHAEHFQEIVKEVLQTQKDPAAVLCAIYDTELYGHWWFEGPEWLYLVLKAFAADPDIRLRTIGEYMDAFPPTSEINLPEGSWGEGGFHYYWLNAETGWTWKLVYEVEVAMSELAQKYGDNKAAKRVLLQAAREAFLLMASDWQFCISSGGAKDYAELRLRNHYTNFNALAELVARAASGKELSVGDWKNVAECEARDSVFPDIDPKWFAKLDRPVK
jgi:1,4-alpha-glucan branching enzyme